MAGVRGRLEGATWKIGRLMVAPDLQGQGLGRALLEHIMAVAPGQATSYALLTGARSPRNLRMYKKAGFRLRSPSESDPGLVTLTRPR